MWQRFQVYVVDVNAHDLTEEDYRYALSRVDHETRDRAKRFYRREDAWSRSCTALAGLLTAPGCLIARLLSLHVVRSLDLTSDIVFRRTNAGKPYLHHPPLLPFLGFNLSHDSGIVLLAARRDEDSLENAQSIGVDVMRITLPRNESYESFVESIEITLTPSESAHLQSLDLSLGLTALYTLWTLKESITKAMGVGLGFDFTGIEYDFATRSLRLLQKPLQGWRVQTWYFGGLDGERYVASVCIRDVDGTNVVDMLNDPPCIRNQAVELIYGKE